jgi:hypothetical protein
MLDWITEQDTECSGPGVLIGFEVQALKPVFETESERNLIMSKEQENKDLVGRWFTGFWGKTYNPAIVDELAAPDMLLQYSLHAPRRGHADIKAFISDFREAFLISISGALLTSSRKAIMSSDAGREEGCTLVRHLVTF